jgi:hypothetical protein
LEKTGAWSKVWEANLLNHSTSRETIWDVNHIIHASYTLSHLPNPSVNMQFPSEDKPWTPVKMDLWNIQACNINQEDNCVVNNHGMWIGNRDPISSRKQEKAYQVEHSCLWRSAKVSGSGSAKI